MTPEQTLALKVLFFAFILGLSALVVLAWTSAIDVARQYGLSATSIACVILATATSVALGVLAYFVASI